MHPFDGGPALGDYHLRRVGRCREWASRGFRLSPAWQDRGMTVDSGDASPGNARTDGLWAERVGTRRYTGRNARGARVRMSVRWRPGTCSPPASC